MSMQSGIARPYALAAFSYAQEHQALPSWGEFLRAASLMMADPLVVSLFRTTAISSENLLGLCQDILRDRIDTHQNNFLLLLHQHKRLLFLPAIRELFNALYAAAQKISTVNLTTAIDIDKALHHKFEQLLTKRFQQEIHLNTYVDPTLLGGYIVQIGDRVIDGSIRGKLNRLLNDLTR
jgi:F-type H+-transporting ATPase subunit delta